MKSIRHVLCVFLIFSLGENIIAQELPPTIGDVKEFFVKINPAGTYLVTGPGDAAVAPSSLDLMQFVNDPTYGLKPGDLIGIEQVGTFRPGTDFPDYQTNLAGVFRGPAGFLSPGPLSTVQFVFTPNTSSGDIPTDIPQDFRISPDQTLYAQVPVGATEILFTPNDSAFADNTDPNNDFGVYVKIKIVSKKLSLETTLLDVNGQPLAGTIPTKLAISGRETVKLTLGALSSFKLIDVDGKGVEAKFQVVNGSQSMPSSLEKGKTLFFERVAILFTGNVFTLKQDIMPVHLGFQELRITPFDTKKYPSSITVVLSVGRPVKLGSKNNSFDQLIIDFAHERGLPPQLIKAQIAQESTEKFDQYAFRYEALTWDLKRFSSSMEPLADAIRFKDFKLINSLNTNLVPKLFPRKIYKVPFKGILSNIPDNYETDVNPGSYTPLLARDIVASNNQVENWITSNIPELDADGVFADFVIKTNFDFVSQTILASSYGLMQLMYPTAVDCCKYKDKIGIGLDPIGLLDPSINVSCGTLYFVNRFIAVNSFQQGVNVPTFSDYKSGLRNALESYNGGKRNPQKDGEKNYNSNVWNRVFNYWPTAEDTNF